MAKKKNTPDAAAASGASAEVASRKLTTSVSASGDIYSPSSSSSSSSFSSTPTTSALTPSASSAAGGDAHIDAVAAGLASLSVVDASPTLPGGGVDTPAAATTITITGSAEKTKTKKKKKAKKGAEKVAGKEKEILPATEKPVVEGGGQGKKKENPKEKEGQKQEQEQEQEPRVGSGKRASPEMFAAANRFIGPGSLEDWQRLCAFVGLVDKTELTSIKKCKVALKRTWVNIHDIIFAITENQPLQPFKSKKQLATYTFKRKLLFPKEEAKKNRPMGAFLTDFF